VGEGQAQRGVDAGEAGERADRQHGGDGHERVAQRPDRLAVGLEQTAGRKAHHDGRQDGGDQHAGAGVGEPGEGEHRASVVGLATTGGTLLDHVVQTLDRVVEDEDLVHRHLNQSLPHTSSTAHTMIQASGPSISAVVTFSVEEAGLAGMVPPSRRGCAAPATARGS